MFGLRSAAGIPFSEVRLEAEKPAGTTGSLKATASSCLLVLQPAINRLTLAAPLTLLQCERDSSAPCRMQKTGGTEDEADKSALNGPND